MRYLNILYSYKVDKTHLNSYLIDIARSNGINHKTTVNKSKLENLSYFTGCRWKTVPVYVDTFCQMRNTDYLKFKIELT